MKFYRIVETDNHGGDYPDEKFCLGIIPTEERAQRLADAINAEFCGNDYAPRFWKVVDGEYKLAPGFEP